mgnify:CR=1 FL=1
MINDITEPAKRNEILGESPLDSVGGLDIMPHLSSTVTRFSLFLEECIGIMELKERLKLIKDRYQELIVKPREEKEKEVEVLYEWDDEPDVLDDAVLARQLRRQREDGDE